MDGPFFWFNWLIRVLLIDQFQLIIFNIPLMLYLGRCLDLSLAANKDLRPACPSQWLWRLAWFFDHSFFVIIITIQLYLVTTGFYRAYGLSALVLCPLRTWAVLLALYLRKQALLKGTTDVSSPATEHVEQNQQQRVPVTRPLVSNTLWFQKRTTWYSQLISMFCMGGCVWDCEKECVVRYFASGVILMKSLSRSIFRFFFNCLAVSPFNVMTSCSTSCRWLLGVCLDALCAIIRWQPLWNLYFLYVCTYVSLTFTYLLM